MRSLRSKGAHRKGCLSFSMLFRAPRRFDSSTQKSEETKSFSNLKKRKRKRNIVIISLIRNILFNKRIQSERIPKTSLGSWMISMKSLTIPRETFKISDKLNMTLNGLHTKQKLNSERIR